MTSRRHRFILPVAALLVFATMGGVRAEPRYDPSRIISIGGAVTEILYALGLQQRIVAVDTTSLYPPEALHEKPNVGYMRQLSPEGVIGLNPSLILATEGSGPKETLALIEAAGIPIVHVPDRYTGEGIAEKINVIAAAVGERKRGDCLAKAVAADVAALAQLRAQISQPLRTIFLLSFLGGRAQVSGLNTAADGVMTLAGAVNAITEYSGYKAVSDEAIIAARPEFVLAMRDMETLNAASVFAHPAFALTPAAKHKAFLAMDSIYLGFGPRTPLAARDLMASLYPSLPVDKFPSETGPALAEACRQ